MSNYFTNLYCNNLGRVWDSLLPSPDIRIIKENGDIEKVNQTIQSIAQHYLYNAAQLTVSLILLPFTCAASTLSSLAGRVEVKQQPSHPKEEPYTCPSFGFANSGFQDGAIGTRYDPSSLNGQGTGDWDKILQRPIQRVTQNGAKIGPATHGITLEEGKTIPDLFVNIMDYPESFANLLTEQNCNAYRISIERSVIEPKPGEFNDFAIQKYQILFAELKNRGIEPWVTLHHFTNPQWFEDAGGFADEKNIDGFVGYCEKMVDSFPEITNWMTFNEPGIRALEGYVRGEHPPQKQHIPTAAQVMRNLLIAHTQAFRAMKAKNKDLHIGITHQWLKFLPFGSNPIEKMVAFFYTSLIHTPIFNFFKDGVMHVKIPFRANVQLRYEDGNTQKIADFLGVQAYGFPRIKIGLNGGVPHPGAADKVNNFVLPFLGFGFTAGSTCEKGGSMQYFGPPSKPYDLVDVLEEAFSIPEPRISRIGITETGSDAKRMDFGEKDIKVDEEAQAQGFQKIFEITAQRPLTCLFLWTLNRHCEWISGGMPHLGVSKLKNEGTRITAEETPALNKIRETFRQFKVDLFQPLDSRAAS